MVNTESSSFFSLGFIQRIPWFVYVLYECNEFEGVLIYSVNIEYSGQGSQFVLVGKPTNSQLEQFKKTILNADSQFVIKLYLAIGRTYIDNNFREIPEPYYIRYKILFFVNVSLIINSIKKIYAI